MQNALPAALPAVAVLVAAMPLLAAQQAPRDAVLRPAQQFVRPRSGLGSVPRGSLLEPMVDDGTLLLTVGGDFGDTPSLDVDRLLTALHRGDRDAGRLVWGIGNEGILLSGDADRVAAANAELDAVAAAFARPIEVTAWLLPPDGDELPGVLDAPGLAAALRRAAPLWTQTTRTQPFANVVLANERWTPHLHHVEVEVAQGNQAARARTGVLMTGVRVGCTVSPLAEGDDLVLDVQLACGEQQALRRTVTGFAGQPDLELPEWRTALAQASARIPDGGALAVQLQARQGGGPDVRLLLSARCPGPRPAAVAPGLLMLPVGALLQAPPAPLVAGLPHTPDNDQPQAAFAPASPFTAAALGEHLQRCAGRELDWSVQAGFLLLVAERPLQERVLAALRQLAASRLQNVELQVETRVADRAAAGAPAWLWRQVLPALACRPGGAFVGTESRTIAEFDVEIAQGASPDNPILDVCPSGLWSAFRLRPQAQTVHADWLAVVASSAPPRRFPLAPEADGGLGLVDLGVAAFPLHGEVEWGRELDLGDGPSVQLGAQPLRTRQFVRMLRRGR